MPALSNAAFLEMVFGPDWDQAWVTSFSGAPGNTGWSGGPAWRELATCQDNTNNYFAVSLLETNATERKEQNWQGLYVPVVDDVGPKVDPTEVELVLGEPTYRIETSPGNEQWGYVLAQPIEQKDVAKQLMAALDKRFAGMDPAKNLVRYVRLPIGFNGKPNVDHQVQLVAIATSARPTADMLAARLGITLSWDKASPGSPGAPAQPGRTGQNTPDTDAILEAFRTLGMVRDGPRKGTSLGAEAWDVVCPWEQDHTGAPTGSAYAPWGGFKCHHGHCAHRTMADLRARLDELLIEAGHTNGLAGMSAGDFDDVDPADLPTRTKTKTKITLNGRNTLPPKASLPRRKWIAKGKLMRGAVTMVYGPPDQGKSLLLTAWAVSLAYGKAWGRLAPDVVGGLRVLTMFTEEDDAEQCRRIYAALIERDIEWDDLGGRLHRLVCHDVATLFTFNRQRQIEPTDTWDALVDVVRDIKPDVVILDPLVELHSAEENDNTQLKAVIAKLRALAQDFDCAVLLSHHTRKGEVIPGTLDMARGASAIGGAVRFALSFVEMTEKEAIDLGRDPQRRRWYVRLDYARNAMSAPQDSTEWFEKVEYILANGDDCGTLSLWGAPQGAAPTQDKLDQIVDAIAQGCRTAAGVRPWSHTLGDHERSIRQLFRKFGIMDKPSQKRTLAALRERDDCFIGCYTDPTIRNGKPIRGFGYAKDRRRDPWAPAGVRWRPGEE